MAEDPPAPAELEATLTAYGFNVQARNAIITMGIDTVDELVDIRNKNLKEPYVMFAKMAKHESRPCEVQVTCN